MEQLIEIRTVVRVSMLDRLVHKLKECGVPRFTVNRLHAIGAGVDPARRKFSFKEGSAYADKAEVRFICSGERCDMFAELIAGTCSTGRVGDGFVSVHPVLKVVNIGTGEEGLHALE